MVEWIRLLEEFVYFRKLEDDDLIFPAFGFYGKMRTGQAISHDFFQSLIDKYTKAAGATPQAGRFTTHCFRRGGPQHRLLFADPWESWSIIVIRDWVGWAEGEYVRHFLFILQILTESLCSATQ